MSLKKRGGREEREEEKQEEEKERKALSGQREALVFDGDGKKKKRRASFSLSFSYPLDVCPHLLEKGRGLGRLGVGAALEVGLCFEEKERGSEREEKKSNRRERLKRGKKSLSRALPLSLSFFSLF